MKEKSLMRMALILIAVFLITGCTKFHPQPISPTETASAFEHRTLDNIHLKEFLEKNLHHKITPWPPNSWDLTALTLTAFYYNPDLDVARAKSGVAEAAIITAGSRPNPSLGFIPQFNSSAESGVSPWILTFIFDIPIETAGKRGYRIAQATHLSTAAQLNIAAVAWQVRSRLRTSLLNLYGATEAETILKRELVVQEEMVSLLGQRLAYGEIPRPDLTQAQISLDQNRLSLFETQKQIAENRVRVAEALGLPVNALNGVSLSFNFLEHLPADLPPPDIQRQALLNRSDILSALSEYEAAEAVLQLEITKQYPNIHLGPGYELDQGQNKWALGFSITLPVFNRNEGPIAEAEARRKEASARFTSLQDRVIGEIDRAQAGYSKALQKLRRAEALLSAQEKQEQFTEREFHLGEADRLALLSAELELTSAHLSRLYALVEAQQSFGLLEDAIQRPLDSGGFSLTAPEISPRSKEENGKCGSNAD
jgi:cobalt-zinc-cadmium efflux system outer membrane protein